MKVLVIGSEAQQEEFKAKFPALSITPALQHAEASRSVLEQMEVVFDFMIEEYPEEIDIYRGLDHLLVFCNTVKSSLAEINFIFGGGLPTIAGFNGLPTFFNRTLLELTLLHEEDRDTITACCNSLGTDFEIVTDRVGMVTPRVIFMIINEAFYTLQEGTAGKEDIDQGMKLGTNYPYGPFEWAERVGLDHVYEVLESLWEDTRDERYKVCPLLKREYLLLGSD